ncbi:MAG: hypothetical protein KDK07_19865 [Bauldia sp.]|nr:hypothetical protein [Bauldia sp.]
MFRRRAAIGLELPTPVRLSDLGFAREPSERVLLSRDRLDQFDADTLFFDVFRTGRRDEIVCIGPSLDGIAPAGLALSFAAEGLAGPIAVRHEPPRMHQQPVGRFVLSAPGLDRVRRLRITAGERSVVVAPGAPRADLLAGHRVLMTLSKDNPLHWIEEWAAFHVARHRASAVLVYDNGSGGYSPEALATTLARVPGLRRAVVVPWPFPYGVGGRPEYPALDNFCQTGMLDHARRRFCTTAASVLNLDVDELLPRKGPSIFDRIESGSLAAIHFRGLWVEREGVREHEQALALRHRDCGYVWRSQLAAAAAGAGHRLCRTKWIAVPSRCGAGAEWGVHEVYAATEDARSTQSDWRMTDETFHYRHFRQINAGWKIDRWRSSEPFDAICVKDQQLARDMTRWLGWRNDRPRHGGRRSNKT